MFGPQHQRDLETPVLLVVEVPLKGRREHRRLDEPHTSPVYAIGVSPSSRSVERLAGITRRFSRGG
ncbi:MAG: hypothetical protein AB7H88_17775 [Vicinamibacterales bacterium]